MNRTQARPSPRRLLGSLALVALIALGGLAMVTRPTSVFAQDAEFVAGDTVVVTADGDGLNLRSEPGLDSEVLETLPDGTVATITAGPEPVDDLTWYEAEIDADRSGWLASEFLTDAATIDPGFEAGDVVQVNTDLLNLRDDASLDAGIIDTMPSGTQATVLDGPVTADGIPWYQIDAGDFGTGWAAGGYLALVEEADGFPAGTVLVVDADLLNLRDGPSLDAGVIDQLPTYAAVTIVSGPQAADGYDWYEVDSDAGTGWVAGAFLASPADLIAIGDTVQVIDGDLNLRDAPGLDSEVIDVMPDGTQLTVVDGPEDADGYTWFQVESDEFGSGWAAGQFLQVISTDEATDDTSDEATGGEESSLTTAETDSADVAEETAEEATPAGTPTT